MRSVNDTLGELSTDQRSAPSPRRRRPRITGALLLLMVAGIVTGVVFALRGGGEDVSSTLPSRPAPLDPAARELVSLMAKGQEGVYHARYRAVSPEQPGATLMVEIWRRGSITRQDSVASDGTQTTHTAGFTLPTGNLACRREAAGAWRCVPVTGARTTTEQLTELATTELSGRSVTARDETIAGRAARCFTIVGEGQSSDICLSSEGIALRVGTGNTRLELISLEEAVDDAVFRPPA